jgi:hypothetical protein
VSGLVITGAAVIVNVCAFDVAAQLATVIDAVPLVAIREAGTVAVSRVEETNVVVSAVPFHFTVEPETKLVPFTVRVNCGPPALAQVGLSELIVGAALIVNVSRAVPVPLPLVAPRAMLYVPTITVGVPEIKPVDVFTVKPPGNGAAAHEVIAWLAVIWYEYGTPVVPQSVVGLVMLGFAASALLATANTTRNGRIFFIEKS